MNERQKWIAKTVRARRMELGLPQAVADIGGPSRTVMGAAEREGILPKTATVQAKFVHVLKWAPTAIEALESGRKPVAVPDNLSEGEILSWIGSIRMQLDALEARLRTH
jgi:hypothetical protein